MSPLRKKAALPPEPALSGAQLKELLELAARATGQEWFVPPRSFYFTETTAATRSLLGCLLLHVTAPAAEEDPARLRVCGGRIVEAEAYLGEHDPAAHAARGLTPVTQIFYRPGGIAYVYKIYGMYYCFNAVVGPEGEAGCVLVRALEPLLGLEEMAARRKVAPAAHLAQLCSGPGKLCQALGINSAQNGQDLTQSTLLILASYQPAGPIAAGPRVGINKAVDWPLRFWLEGSPWVSKAK